MAVVAIVVLVVIVNISMINTLKEDTLPSLLGSI
jgi:hypothetical protein